MTELDLTLLTEQERDDIAGIKEHIDAAYSQECADRLASSLIAARAENKRLMNIETVARGMLSSIDAILNAKSAGDVSVGNSHLLMAADKLRALLQSEKGGE